MPVDPQLRNLDIEIPTQPEVLVKLSLLMAAEDIDLQAMSALVETDMALAAAVMKAVNSSLYGLRGRVQTVIGLEDVSMFWAYVSMPVGGLFSVIAIIGNWLDPKRLELETAQ